MRLINRLRTVYFIYAIKKYTESIGEFNTNDLVNKRLTNIPIVPKYVISFFFIIIK